MILLVQPPKLVLAIVGAAHELTCHKSTPQWVTVDAVRARLAIVDVVKVDAAIQYALDHNFLLSDGGRPPHSIVTTAYGIRLAKNCNRATERRQP